MPDTDKALRRHMHQELADKLHPGNRKCFPASAIYQTISCLFYFQNLSTQHRKNAVSKMIEKNNEVSKDLEKALQALKQAQQRVANEKKKQNEKKRKAEKPLPHKPLSPMPKMKVRAVRNDEGNETGKPR